MTRAELRSTADLAADWQVRLTRAPRTQYVPETSAAPVWTSQCQWEKLGTVHVTCA